MRTDNVNDVKKIAKRGEIPIRAPLHDLDYPSLNLAEDKNTAHTATHLDEDVRRVLPDSRRSCIFGRCMLHLSQRALAIPLLLLHFPSSALCTPSFSKACFRFYPPLLRFVILLFMFSLTFFLFLLFFFFFRHLLTAPFPRLSVAASL